LKVRLGFLFKQPHKAFFGRRPEQHFHTSRL
jgi:hypothetical protein